MYDHAMTAKRSVGIIGGSGYTGAELLRLLAGHPHLELRYATGDSQAGNKAADLYPSLAAAYPDLVFSSFDPADADGLDLVFCALPHGTSGALVPDLRKRVGVIVDLAADFRLRDAAAYPVWYGEEHPSPELLGDSVLGIPELFRSEIAASKLVASAGCYVTAASLAIAPLAKTGLIERSGIIVDAATGISGAGRGLKHSSLYATVSDNFEAYGLLNHRHTPEIEQATGTQVLFTPHYAPMTRGMHATIYAKPTGSAMPSTEGLLHALADGYANEPFVVVREAPPSSKATLGTNVCHLSARYDGRTNTVIILSALDNLTKGASGQAVQCANIALGLPETAGLPIVGVYP
jgi:N-acetyl-gamma-glutamyl-phosphate reductase